MERAKAIVTMTRGMGVERYSYTFKNNKDMIEWSETFVANNNHHKKMIMGIESEIIIEKIVFNYTSGKSFTKRHI